MPVATEPAAEGVPVAGAAQPGDERAAKRGLWLVAGGVLIVWSAHNALLLPWEVHHTEEAVREPALVLLRAVTWMVPALLYLRRHDPRRPLEALGVTARINPRGLLKSTVGAAIYLALIVMLLRANTPPEAASAAWAALAPLTVVYMVLKAALEELLMRGFLLGQLVRFTSSFRAQASVAVLFMLMHLPNWVAVEHLGIEQLLPSAIVVLVLGIVLGAVARASNNIIPAIVLHFLNNLIGELAGS
jgi:membrane protease YdiL (CAAX protease family)